MTVTEAVLITISICVPVTSCFVLFIMALLRASKESDCSLPAQQSDIEKVESLEIYVLETGNQNEIKVGWRGKYKELVYGDYIEMKFCGNNCDLIESVNLLLRQGLETLKEVAKIEREGPTKEYLELLASIKQKESCDRKDE